MFTPSDGERMMMHHMVGSAALYGLFVIVLFLLRVLGVFVHEMGHLIVGLMLFPSESFDVFFGSYGKSAKASISFRIPRATFYVRINPVLFLGGLTARNEPRPSSVISVAMFVLGGPLAELALGILAMGGLFTPIPDALRLILFFVGCSSLFSVVVNLYPFAKTVRGGRRKYSSDGHQLMALYRLHRTRYGPYSGVKFWE